ncbi:esterase family protein, partial [Burkholderia sp. Se-20373]|nr:esterase family protein [Burkholderia sp. Se-20373]
MRRLALAFAPALIAGSIATARATPPAPAAAPAVKVPLRTRAYCRVGFHA